MRSFLLSLSLFVCAAALSAAAPSASASDPQSDIPAAKLALLERVATAMRLEEQYEMSMVAGFDAAVAPTLKSMPNDDMRDKMKRGIKRVKAMMNERMGFAVMKPEIFAIYASRFSEDELKAVVAMLETPVGKMWSERSNELLPAVMAISQEQAQTIMPEVQRIMMEEMQKP